MKLLIAITAILLLALPAHADRPSYYAPLNDVWPGYGRDSSSAAPLTPVHEPMAYGLLVSAFVVDGLPDDARRAADWLVSNNDLNGNGVPGWGLPFAWDAFSDGSINPIHTEYGVTTAVAVQGLLDFYESTTEAKYLNAAVAALEAYAAEFRDGDFRYSVAPTDSVPTHNITAMLMGQYARAGRLAARDDFSRLATKSYNRLMSISHSDSTGIWWSYVEGNAKTNDLVHASYIVRGLIDFQAPADVIEKAANYLKRFVRGGVVYDTVESSAYLARSWGIGAALNIACSLGDNVTAASLEQALPPYMDSKGAYLLRPNEGYFAPRLQAHVAWGLSRCNASTIPG